MRSSRRKLLAACLLAVTLTLAGCLPEATRERGGDQGGDPGNHGSNIQLHGDQPERERIYYQTPSLEPANERSDGGGTVSAEP